MPETLAGRELREGAFQSVEARLGVAVEVVLKNRRAARHVSVSRVNDQHHADDERECTSPNGYPLVELQSAYCS